MNPDKPLAQVKTEAGQLTTQDQTNNAEEPELQDEQLDEAAGGVNPLSLNGKLPDLSSYIVNRSSKEIW